LPRALLRHGHVLADLHITLIGLVDALLRLAGPLLGDGHVFAYLHVSFQGLVDALLHLPGRLLGDGHVLAHLDVAFERLVDALLHLPRALFGDRHVLAHLHVPIGGFFYAIDNRPRALPSHGEALVDDAPLISRPRGVGGKHPRAPPPAGDVAGDRAVDHRGLRDAFHDRPADGLVAHALGGAVCGATAIRTESGAVEAWAAVRTRRWGRHARDDRNLLRNGPRHAHPRGLRTLFHYRFLLVDGIGVRDLLGDRLVGRHRAVHFLLHRLVHGVLVRHLPRHLSLDGVRL